MLTSCLFDEDINLFISLITFKGGTRRKMETYLFYILWFSSIYLALKVMFDTLQRSFTEKFGCKDEEVKQTCWLDAFL